MTRLAVKDLEINSAKFNLAPKTLHPANPLIDIYGNELDKVDPKYYSNG